MFKSLPKKLIAFLLMISTGIVHAQHRDNTYMMKKVKLTQQDISDGIIERYVHYFWEGGEVLELFKNGRYQYSMGRNGGDRYNEGTWKKIKGELILTDQFDKDNLPIALICLNKADTIYNFVVQIIKNLNGEELTDGFVYINNDSTSCDPLLGSCLQNYSTIDSIKVHFANGYKSKWIKTPCRNYQQLALTLQSKLSMATYDSLYFSKFRVYTTSIKAH